VAAMLKWKLKWLMELPVKIDKLKNKIDESLRRTSFQERVIPLIMIKKK
jgi:hypothetical protein